MRRQQALLQSSGQDGWARQDGWLAGCAHVPAQLGLSHECRLSGGLRLLAAESLVHRLFHLPAAASNAAGEGGRRQVSVPGSGGRQAGGSSWPPPPG